MPGKRAPQPSTGGRAATRERHAAEERRAAPAAAAAQVSLRWLLTALGVVVAGAVGCTFLALCLLFAQGQWQLLYHPGQPGSRGETPAAVGLGYTAVRFGNSDGGMPELTGWWVPAATDAPAPTVLYLHDGAGWLADTVGALGRLHGLGCAVLAIDYRGYGASAAGHPGEQRMVEDAERAVEYLLETRHVAPGSLVIWGRGIGATIAAESGRGHPLVLEAVNRPALEVVCRDARSRYLPIRLLLRDRLDAAAAVGASSAPKLFVQGPEDDTQRVYAAARGPKTLVAEGDGEQVRAFLRAAAGGR
ncbi:MAG TPA: alpha/beta hydrolase [Acidobacteriaceae bacterium]